jgi:hypothetical protein
VKSGATSPTLRVFVSLAIFVRPFGAAIAPRLSRVQKIDERRRITVDRRAFTHYEVACPFCGENVGPRFVTREHLDIPPNPPYAATVRCPRCKEEFEVLFGSS